MHSVFPTVAKHLGFRLAAVCAIFVGVLAASVSVADLYVVQVGDGAAALSSASTAAFVKKFADTGGSPLATINLPTADSGANKALTLSGTSTSEGFLALSTSGQYLTMAGYGVGPGTASVPQTDSTIVNRVIGRIEVSSGTIDTSTALTDAYTSGGAASNANIRSAVSMDGTQFWTTGTNAAATTASGGVRYSVLGGTTSTQLSSTPTNTRVVDIYNGQLYVSTGSSSFLGVNTVGTGLPTTDSQTTTLLTGFPTTGTHSSYDYWFKDANTLYVADDGSATNGGGIQKWEYNGAAWLLSYTLLNSGTSTTAVRGLTGTVVGSDVVLYATTTQTSANRLISVIDTGAGATSTELAAAPTNTAFRGVQFVAASVSVPGDYNGDGKVNAADYVLWRDNPASYGGDPAGYNTWRSNFGAGEPGSGLGGGAAVPEPTSLALLLLGLSIVGIRRR